MKTLIIGLGEIGQAVFDLIIEEDVDVKVHDTKYGPQQERFTTRILHNNDVYDATPFDVMHICFPYSERFVEDVHKYIIKYEPKHVAIWSTVPIGTCEKIGFNVVHTPVEGVHPVLEESMRIMCRWIGFDKGSEGKFFAEYFEKRGMNVWPVSGTRVTELIKLRSTAKYGINLVWAEYEQELCKKFGVPYDTIMQFDKDYNHLYRHLGRDDYIQRYVLYPPDGSIGGHCVVPNAKLLNEQMPSDLLDKIIAMEKE